MRHDKISDKESCSINAESIDNNNRCIEDLRRTIDQKDEEPKNDAGCFVAYVVKSVLLDLADQKQNHFKDPEHLDIPKRTDTTARQDQVQNRFRNCGHLIKRSCYQQIVVSQDPLKDEEANRRRHQQFSGSCSKKILRRFCLQLESCGHARYNKKQQHEPGIDQIQKSILELNITEWPNDSIFRHAIKHIDNVINNNENYCDPANIVQVSFSHICTASLF